MKILVYCVEEMKDGNIKTLGEFRTKEEAEDVRANYEDRFIRIVKKETDSIRFDLEDTFLALCGMTKCDECPYNCVGQKVKAWYEMDTSEQAAMIKKMARVLREHC